MAYILIIMECIDFTSQQSAVASRNDRYDINLLEKLLDWLWNLIKWVHCIFEFLLKIFFYKIKFFSIFFFSENRLKWP